MSRHGRNKTADYLAYLLVRVIQAGTMVAPWWALRGLAHTLGPVLYTVGGRHRRRVLLQMRLAFGEEKSEAEIRSLARTSFKHLVMFVIESLCISRITKRNADRYIDRDHFDLSAFEGRSTIILTAHLGGFQPLMHTITLKGRPMGAVQRPLDNPYDDSLLQKQREAGGTKFISKFDNLLRVREFAREKRSIGLATDQNGGRRGVFADFLGFPASTWTSAADLHFMLKLPIVIAFAPRVGLGPKLRLEVPAVREYDPALAKEWKSSPERRAEITREIVEWMNDVISDAIRRHPEQWMWQHRRWKTRPKDETVPIRDGVPCPWLVEEAGGEEPAPAAGVVSAS